MLYFTHHFDRARVYVRGVFGEGFARELCDTLDLLTLTYCHETIELVVDSCGGSLDELFAAVVFSAFARAQCYPEYIALRDAFDYQGRFSRRRESRSGSAVAQTD